MKIKRIVAVFMVFVMVFVSSVVCQTSDIAAKIDGLQENTNYYLIVSKKTGQAMTAENYTSDIGIRICQMPIGNYQAQVWTLEEMKEGYYRILNPFSKLVFNVPAASTEEGVQMMLWYQEDNDNSKWKITQLEDGSYRITPKMVETFSLAVEEGNTSAGAAIVQSTFQNTENEKWELVPIEESQIKDNPEFIVEVAQPEKAFEAYTKMFTYEEDGVGKLNYCEPFWTSAETIEMLIDAYERFGEEKYKTLFCKQLDGFIKRNGTDWRANPYNDDMMWAVIMVSRAYLLTGDERYLTYAEQNFKVSFERGWSEDLGGGLWWRTDEDEKNACANGPGAVAACLLGQATGNEEYYEKAKMIIEWEYEFLSDKEGGIWDNVKKDGVTYNQWVSTYNQGTFIGACTMLYQHYNDQKFYDWAKAAADRSVQLGSGTQKYLNGEEGGVDLMGFKGILARWMGYFAVNCNIDDYNDWMQGNADIAWTNRNSDDLMWTQFAKVTEENIQFSTKPLNGGEFQVGDYSGWACSAAVAWLLDCTGIDERQEKKLKESESIGITAAKTAISNAIRAAKDTYDAGQDVYSDPSWKKFVTAYNNALNLNADATVNELKAIQYALEEAQNTLKLKNPPGKLIEIESGEPSKDIVTVESKDCSGGIYVANVGGEKEGKITFMVTAERAGEHIIAVNYCTFDDRQLKVLVNGQEYTVTCKGAGSWDIPAENPAEVTVSMHQGENTIEFTGVETYSAPNLDCFKYNRTDSKENREIDTITDELDAVVLKADEIFSAGQNNYTEESWNRFKAAYEMAVNPIGAISVEDISKIKDELINAQNGLVEKEISDKDEFPDKEDSTEGTTPDKEDSTGGSTTDKEEGSTGGSTTDKEEGSTGGSTSDKEEGSTGGSTSDKEEGSTGGSTTDKDEGSTGGSTSDKEEGSTGGSTSDKEEGSTGGSTTDKDEGSTGGSTLDKDEGSTGGSTSDKEEGSTGGSTSDKEEGSTEGTTPDKEISPDGEKVSNAENSEENKSLNGNTENDNSSGVSNGNGAENQGEAGKGDDAKQEKKIEKIKINGISKKIAAGKKVKLTAMIFPEKASEKEIVWESSNKKYATVTKKGLVKTKKAGKNKSVIITARAKDNDAIKAVYKIKIMPQAVKKIEINASTQTVKAGSKISLKAVVTPNLAPGKINAKLKWSSSNEEYATVTSKGVVKTKKAGKGEKVKITARATDGSNKKESIVININ